MASIVFGGSLLVYILSEEYIRIYNIAESEQSNKIYTKYVVYL